MGMSYTLEDGEFNTEDTCCGENHTGGHGWSTKASQVVAWHVRRRRVQGVLLAGSQRRHPAQPTRRTVSPKTSSCMVERTALTDRK